MNNTRINITALPADFTTLIASLSETELVYLRTWLEDYIWQKRFKTFIGALAIPPEQLTLVLPPCTLPKTAIRILDKAGLRTLGDLKKVGSLQLRLLPGVTPRLLNMITEELALSGHTLPDHPAAA